jgi:hypothetical protein
MKNAIKLTKLQSEALIYFVEGKYGVDKMPKNYSNSLHALTYLGILKNDYNSDVITQLTDLGNSTYFSI